MLLIVYKDKDADAALPLDLTPFIAGDKFTYTVCDEENKKIAEGELAAKDMFTLSAPAGSLYMVEIKAK